MQERLRAWFGVAKNSNLLVVSVFAVRASQKDCTVSKTYTNNARACTTIRVCVEGLQCTDSGSR